MASQSVKSSQMRGTDEELEEQINEIIDMAFMAYDVDDSGFLERSEIRRLIDDMCKEFGAPIMTDEQLDDVIFQIDENNDGKFSIDELVSIIKPILHRQLS